VYPSIHHVEVGADGDVLGSEVEIGSSDWTVALFSIARITQTNSLVEA
jgi:hypothetical protein